MTNSTVNVEADPQQAFDLKRQTEKECSAKSSDTFPRQKDPDKEIMDRIRQTLNPNARISRQKAPAYVPAQIEQVMGILAHHVEEKGVILSETININYGKKLRFKMEHRQAEINLFYGKRGFSVVVSPRSGTDAEMNQLMADVIENFLIENF